MKLCQNRDDIEIVIMSKMHRTSVGKVFKIWLNFMYYQFKEIDLFLPNYIIDILEGVL
uniref:Putative LOC101242628 [Ciona intestinalis] n=1 Tax=Lepeophtheirus salmonis TaxID=72036 RepID=A0A0K2U5A2_LEPSM